MTNCVVVGRAKPCRQKRAGAVGAGQFLNRHGRYLRDVCARLPRKSWQRHPVDGADSLLAAGKVLRIEVFHTDTPFLLAMLPPAPIRLGMMLAIKYLIDERSKQRKAQAAGPSLSPVRRDRESII